MATLAELDTLIDNNLSAFRAIAGAYEVLLGGVPNIDGFVSLINNARATNFGSNRTDVTFNQENAMINLVAGLVRFNTDAGAKFDAIVAGAATTQDQLKAIYEAYVPEGAQTPEGLAFFSRPEAVTFYQNVAAERGVPGADGAAIVALASLLNILVNSDVGVGDAINDLRAAIDAGNAALPTSGNTFTPIETADGTAFDADDNAASAGGTFVLTPGQDFADSAGSIRNIVNGTGIPSDFKFTSGNDTIVATTATLTAGDALVDSTTTDEDVVQVAASGGAATLLRTMTNLENFDINFNGYTGGTVGFGNVTGGQDVDLTGTLGAQVTLNNIAFSGITDVDGSGLTSVVNGFAVSFSADPSNTARTVTGSGAGDNITGGNGADTINAGAGNNLIDGVGGNDAITAGDGSDLILGGNGGDTISAGGGTDAVAGESGDDTIDGGGGADGISGGTGGDTIRGAGGNDTIGLGNSTFSGGGALPGSPIETVTAGAIDSDTDTVVFEATAAANGNDRIFGFNVDDGANEADVLDFTAFLGGAADFEIVNDLLTDLNTVDGNVFELEVGTGVNSGISLANAIGNGITLDQGNNVFLVDAGANTEVYFVVANALGEAVSIDLVGTVAGVDIGVATFHDYNFA